MSNMPLSRARKGVADVLKREGYIWDYQEIDAEPVKAFAIEIKYGRMANKSFRVSVELASLVSCVYEVHRTTSSDERFGNHDYQHVRVAW